MPAFLPGLLAASPAIMSGLSLLFGGGKSDEEERSDAALQQLLRMQQQQYTQMDPLRQALLKMAMGMLPRQYQTPTAEQGPLPPGATGRAVPRPGGPISRSGVTSTKDLGY